MIRVIHCRRTLLLFVMAMLSSVGVWAQSNLTGVNTRTPTEALHVDGTMRVSEVILNGGPGYYYGYNVVSTNLFNQNALVVADKNGVLGKSYGEIEKFFYMPPILLPLHDYAADAAEKSVGGVYNINLYNHYVKQFTLADATTSVCSPSGNTTTNRLPVRALNELEFFVIYCPPNVFQSISVSETGVLTYRVLPGVSPDQFTYVNVVFKVKS